MTNADRHAFAPSRPGGTVCVTMRTSLERDAELCGYPAAHPIHGPLQLDLSPRAAPMRTDAEDLRANLWGLVEHAWQAPPGDPALCARVDEITQRWGSERTVPPA